MWQIPSFSNIPQKHPFPWKHSPRNAKRIRCCVGLASRTHEVFVFNGASVVLLPGSDLSPPHPLPTDLPAEKMQGCVSSSKKTRMLWSCSASTYTFFLFCFVFLDILFRSFEIGREIGEIAYIFRTCKKFQIAKIMSLTDMDYYLAQFTGNRLSFECHPSFIQEACAD